MGGLQRTLQVGLKLKLRVETDAHTQHTTGLRNSQKRCMPPTPRQQLPEGRGGGGALREAQLQCTAAGLAPPYRCRSWNSTVPLSSTGRALHIALICSRVMLGRRLAATSADASTSCRSVGDRPLSVCAPTR